MLHWLYFARGHPSGSQLLLKLVRWVQAIVRLKTYLKAFCYSFDEVGGAKHVQT